VFRAVNAKGEFRSDKIALDQEAGEGEPLLVPVMRNGPPNRSARIDWRVARPLYGEPEPPSTALPPARSQAKVSRSLQQATRCHARKAPAAHAALCAKIAAIVRELPAKWTSQTIVFWEVDRPARFQCCREETSNVPALKNKSPISMRLDCGSP